MTYFGSFKRRVERQVRDDSARSIQKIKASEKQKGLFVDCGSNLGQGFAYFEKHFPLQFFDFILVEPNPHCAEALNKLVARHKVNVELIEAAAATSSGTALFFGLTEDHRGKTSDGGSVLEDHNSVLYKPDKELAITVRTFSLAELLQQKAKEYPVIVMKLDIEGGEYAVLEDMLNNDAAMVLDSIYVEFHSKYMIEPKRSLYREREIAIENEFRRRGLPFRLWC